MKYLEGSIDWVAVCPLVDLIQSHDLRLVGGYTTVTGHQEGQESTDRCVSWLLAH
ncbi:MAG: hypothetical protein QM530_02650 [Phycisphaerales bacterium]|nr:hypothetical protein [Phycisphaerales bacterium]